LYTATRNIAVRHIRAEQRRVARERAAMAIAPDPTPLVDADQLRPVIDEVLERLGERDRELVLLRFFRGSTFVDLAQRYGITEDAARFRLNRALERMRSLLAKNGITSTPALIGAALAQPAHAALTEALISTVTAGALTQAATTSVGVGASVLHLMTTTQTAAVAGILLACVGGFWLRRDYAAVQSARSDLAAETRAYESAVAELQAAQAAVPARAKTSLTALAPARVSTAAASNRGVLLAPAPASSLTSPAASPTKREINWAMSRDPEIRATLSTWVKSGQHAGLAAFYRQTGLAPEKITVLEELLLQRNIYMGPNALLTLRPEGKAEGQVEAEIRQLLGEPTYGQFQQYSLLQFVSAVSTGVAALTYDSETPLTAPQADQLTRLLASHSATRMPFPKDVNWAEALPAAKAMLSSSQYAALVSLAATVGRMSAAVNAINPGTFGDPLNPPSSLYTLGTKP
jgi:hypothetical protein